MVVVDDLFGVDCGVGGGGIGGIVGVYLGG